MKNVRIVLVTPKEVLEENYLQQINIQRRALVLFKDVEIPSHCFKAKAADYRHYTVARG